MARAALVDPTKPLHYKTASVKKMQRSALPQLTSILTHADQHSAVLNNQLYKTGQWVGGYHIKRIEAHAVVLDYKNKSYKLSLYADNERFIN